MSWWTQFTTFTSLEFSNWNTFHWINDSYPIGLLDWFHDGSDRNNKVFHKTSSNKELEDSHCSYIGVVQVCVTQWLDLCGRQWANDRGEVLSASPVSRTIVYNISLQSLTKTAMHQLKQHNLSAWPRPQHLSFLMDDLDQFILGDYMLLDTSWSFSCVVLQHMVASGSRVLSLYNEHHVRQLQKSGSLWQQHIQVLLSSMI